MKRTLLLFITIFLSIALTPLASAEVLTCFSLQKTCTEHTAATDEQLMQGLDTCFKQGSIPLVGAYCEVLRDLFNDADIENCLLAEGVAINDQSCQTLQALFNGTLFGLPDGALSSYGTPIPAAKPCDKSNGRVNPPSNDNQNVLLKTNTQFQMI